MCLFIKIRGRQVEDKVREAKAMMVGIHHIHPSYSWIWNTENSENAYNAYVLWREVSCGGCHCINPYGSDLLFNLQSKNVLFHERCLWLFILFLIHLGCVRKILKVALLILELIARSILLKLWIPTISTQSSSSFNSLCHRCAEPRRQWMPRWLVWLKTRMFYSD